MTRTARAGLGGSSPGLCWQLTAQTHDSPALGTHCTDLLPLPVQLCLVICLLEATGFASLRHLDPILKGCPGERARQELSARRGSTACRWNGHICPSHEPILQSWLEPLKAAAVQESSRVILRAKTSHQAQDPDSLTREPPYCFKLPQHPGLARMATCIQNPCSTLLKCCTHLGRASLLFMYSLYSSWVSKSQRPRGPFLLPCSETTTESSSLVNADQGFSCSPTCPGKISIAHWPQFNGLVHPVWPWLHNPPGRPEKPHTGDSMEEGVKMD